MGCVLPMPYATYTSCRFWHALFSFTFCLVLEGLSSKHTCRHSSSLGVLLVSYVLPCLLVSPFGVPLDFNTLANLILMSFIFTSSEESATICCYFCDFVIHLYLLYIFLYLIITNVINVSLSMFYT